MTIAALIRDLRTAPALAREVVRVLDGIARDDALELLGTKPVSPLPPDADWLTRHHYMTIKAVRDKIKAEEQARAWAEHIALQGGA